MYTCFTVDDLRLEIIFSRLTGELLFAKGTFICIAIEQHQTFQATVCNRTLFAEVFIHRTKKMLLFLAVKLQLIVANLRISLTCFFPRSTLT